MLNFQLLPGDRYDGRCAEIYITEKQFLIFHCSVCEEIYTTFNELFSHITKSHYKYTKEYSKFKNKKSVDVLNQQENNAKYELPVKKEFDMKGNIFNKQFVGNFKTLEEMISGKESTTNILEQNNVPEIKDPLELLDSSKSQRKKQRIVTLKNYAINKTKLNPLTSFPLNPNHELKHECDICGFAFKERYNLRNHLLRHSNQKKFNCSICPKKLFTKAEYRQHEYRHKGYSSYLCNHCGMGFVGSGSLTQHIRKHQRLNRPFKCEQCDKGYPKECKKVSLETPLQKKYYCKYEMRHDLIAEYFEGRSYKSGSSEWIIEEGEWLWN